MYTFHTTDTLKSKAHAHIVWPREERNHVCGRRKDAGEYALPPDTHKQNTVA